MSCCLVLCILGNLACSLNSTLFCLSGNECAATDFGEVCRDLRADSEVRVVFDELVHASPEHVDVVEALGEEVSGDSHRNLLAVVDADDLCFVFVVFLGQTRGYLGEELRRIPLCRHHIRRHIDRWSRSSYSL